jgi:putative endonuclease
MSESSKTSYVLYIVECADDTLYTGISNNIEKRLRQHNGEIVGGAFYTRNKRPVKLVYKEEYETHLEASRREIEIKKFTRKKKENLIKEKHPSR